MSTGTAVMSDRILSQSVETAPVHAPLAAINIADWLFTLPDKEYQRCAPPDHKAAGYTSTDDGRPMSINVEMIGTGLVVQHYVAEVAEKQHCHMVSLSDVLTPNGWTSVQVVWDLSVKDNGDGTLTYTNSVTSRPTEEFMEFCDKNGLSFEEAARARQAASGDHCRRETPLFAASIERHAMSRTR
ncbi:hypothetical protein ACFO3J_02365 [Streptomyces polygonati]|uniref:Polyketide cyclase n=1 Tax=Streptomyces polygonati TaxID=1617087 RepID=A0ABV8HHE9_9ACTN